ncbi:ferredoxin [Nonomuraea spiralis]|uniref:Ferredoxin n=1 Tax=Nonomuraea spiralis TaxID=46182 RepID=A0ABV5ILR9_9ACTN|nr:ferredoxin [Nonomuraea spiralis]GGT22899.1 ferredoxin [Nonomuraea spiralis]
MKVTVDQDACTGSGQCVLIAPGVFDQRDEDGIVVLLEDHPEPGLLADVGEAARICPALAITLTATPTAP